MWYYELKVLHVVIACMLLGVCMWSLTPVRLALIEKPAFHFSTAARRMPWVIPLGGLQAVLGMAVLAFEPSPTSVYQSAILLGAFVLLGLLWLVGLALVKYCSVNPERIREKALKKLHYLWIAWSATLLLVFLIMLFVMVNFR